MTDGDALPRLRATAAERRAARRRMADLYAEHGRYSAERPLARADYEAVNARWAQAIRDAVAAGHTIADVCRAAGCTRPTVHYWMTKK